MYREYPKFQPDEILVYLRKSRSDDPSLTVEEVLEREDLTNMSREILKAYKENKFNPDLDYWTNFLNLREATIKEYGKDPCVTGNYGLTPEGDKVEPTYGEQEAIQEMCDTIKDMIEESQNDPAIFSTLMQSAMKKR